MRVEGPIAVSTFMDLITQVNFINILVIIILLLIAINALKTESCISHVDGSICC